MRVEDRSAAEAGCMVDIGHGMITPKSTAARRAVHATVRVDERVLSGGGGAIYAESWYYRISRENEAEEDKVENSSEH